MNQLVGMELRHLRYFVVVAAHGSFNRAAKALHLTQPALSRQVKDLEEELSVQLFSRGKNTVSLTAAGELFYDEAREVLARAEQAVQKVRGDARAETLRIGYSPSVTAGVLPRTLEKFQAESPGTRIELADVSPPEMVQMAKEGRLDVLISVESSVSAITGFQWTELRRLSLVLVMRQDHPLAKLKRIPPKRLRDLPLVGLAQASYPDYVPYVRRILKPFGFSPNFIVLETDGVMTLFANLEAYNAAAILAESVVGFMPRSLVCRPFSPSFDPIVAKIGISETRHGPHAELFANLLRFECGKSETS